MVGDLGNQHIYFPSHPVLPSSFSPSALCKSAQLVRREYKQGQGHDKCDAHMGPQSCSLSWPCQPWRVNLLIVCLYLLITEQRQFTTDQYHCGQILFTQQGCQAFLIPDSSGRGIWQKGDGGGKWMRWNWVRPECNYEGQIPPFRGTEEEGRRWSFPLEELKWPQFPPWDTEEERTIKNVRGFSSLTWSCTLCWTRGSESLGRLLTSLKGTLKIYICTKQYLCTPVLS